MERYQNTVRAIFSAHTHNDHIVLHRESANKDKITKIDWINPSLTTYSNLQPSFRVFKIDKETNEVVDYD
jgi:sphingomyelin phosphodiesterase